eukprot:SAG31_NODE_1819_length_7201_cov_9.661504_6_plen_69_part_00
MLPPICLGCDCIIVDDMIDTAGTLTKAADEIKAFGAARVFAFATHGKTVLLRRPQQLPCVQSCGREPF